MKKNLYFRSVIRRENLFKKFVLDFFFAIASYPRLLIEVFIRRNFGERYFSMASAVWLTVLLLAFPIIAMKLSSLTSPAAVFGGGDPNQVSAMKDLFGSGLPYEDVDVEQIKKSIENNPAYGGRPGSEGRATTQSRNYAYIAWYLYLIPFAWFSYLRHREVQRAPSVFDFGQYSLSSGDIHPRFYRMRLFGIKNTERNREIYYEPAPFLAAGILLAVIGQALGWLLIVAALCYGFSYAAAYAQGDDFVLDKIDEMIMNEEMMNAFVEDKPADQTRGVRFYMKRPTSKEDREKAMDGFFEEGPSTAPDDSALAT